VEGNDQRRCKGGLQMTSSFRAGSSTKAVGMIGWCCAIKTTKCKREEPKLDMLMDPQPLQVIEEWADVALSYVV